MLRTVIACLVLAACATDTPVEAPDKGEDELPALAVHGLPTGQLSSGALASMFACRARCWDEIPFDMCRTQRDTCVQAATSDDGKKQCRQMSRLCRKTRRECLQSCNPASRTSSAR